MPPSNRRYDIDWVRVIAIGLLLIYHVAIGFQPWGDLLLFIVNEKSWQSLWIPMTMLNVWRIPLLFFVSGMGVYFSIQNRDWKQLLSERAARILVPFLFGTFVIFPISLFIWQYHYHYKLQYNYEPGHLWFLGNIFVYVVLLCPIFFYLKNKKNGKPVAWIKKIFGTPFGLLLVIAAFMAEAVLVHPELYELYAMTWHGYFLGLLAFFFGFCFMLSGEPFWNMLLQWRWIFLVAAGGLYTFRLFQPERQVPGYQLGVESVCWIFTVLAFGFKYLNHPGKALTYLSEAAYPVYILHMIFLYLGSTLLFPMKIDVHLKFLLVLLFTVVGCFVTYEFIRRVKLLRPLFGMKIR